MANFSSAFGFKVYLTPVASSAVDTNSVVGGVGVGGFLDPTTVVADNAVIAEGSTLSQITVGGVDSVFDACDVDTETVFELEGLQDASLSTDTSSEEVVTYSDESGYAQGVATSKTWSIALQGVTDFSSAGYQALRLIEKNNVAGALRVKIGRTTPSGEDVYGYATLQGFSESVEAGSIVTYSLEASGYGPLGLTLAPAPADCTP